MRSAVDTSSDGTNIPAAFPFDHMGIKEPIGFFTAMVFRMGAQRHHTVTSECGYQMQLALASPHSLPVTGGEQATITR